ncbi:hypothetical protein Bpfe_021901 [Biomphalaria pfeifferi]|uniref:Uncharacterized protein n=1 Tax=Biomphalaria pfeifferi TaxID=112525 RepID=A0AAD8F342_BIOPF|nr:hypothetical protein Bpfe_021901 [Biomphalaria pfeifferi]
MSSHDSSPTEATELPSLATIDTSSTNNINMKQYVSVKQSLPKTRLTSTILYENTSHDRHLELKLASLEHRRERTLEAFEITRRAFIKQQAKKRRKWMREDEIKLSSLNLPSLSPAVVERRPSVEVVYHCILNNPETETKQLKRKPVLPMLKMRKERTEIVSHHEKTFLTRLPSYVEIDYKVQNKFDSYRGKDFLNHGYPCKDERFVRLHTLLQPRPRKKRLWEIF